ncbi:hypothetical protein V6N11_030746 [Hibiscus sabdariffa]|uniref:Uncharacterized protein n=1 Tax=Hibiscus sabdariffa TaxID=183260 RepID=A0ABR2NBN5_9ROSI
MVFPLVDVVARLCVDTSSTIGSSSNSRVAASSPIQEHVHSPNSSGGGNAGVQSQGDRMLSSSMGSMTSTHVSLAQKSRDSTVDMLGSSTHTRRGLNNLSSSEHQLPSPSSINDEPKSNGIGNQSGAQEDPPSTNALKLHSSAHVHNIISVHVVGIKNRSILL